MGERALREVRDYARAGFVEFEVLAYERMDEFDIDEEDIVHALENAKSCRAQPNGRWVVHGSDLDSYDLKVVIEVRDRIIVVTAMFL